MKLLNRKNVEITSCDFISGTVPEVTWINLRKLRNKSRDGLYLTPKKALQQLHKLHNLLKKNKKNPHCSLSS